MMRAARVDDNQKQIVATFRACGWSVAHTHTVGNGFPDIVVGKNRVNYLIEIKDGSKPPSAQALTRDEVKFHSEWKGHVTIISSIDEALNFINERSCE